jgi:proteasome lid subunit RPN8/RPN11
MSEPIDRDRRRAQKVPKQFLRLYPQVLEHAREEHPREACGLLVKVSRGPRSRVVYRRCRNVAPAGAARDRFELCPHDWAAAEDEGDILAVVHSHPDSDAHPSEADRWHCARMGLPWFIVAWPGGAWLPLWPDPLPLVGRAFEHGTVDCYTLVRDYYAQHLGIELPDFDREDGWWERRVDAKGRLMAPQNLYREHFAEAGFVDVGTVEPVLHDVLLMQVHADVENHAAVYVQPDAFGPRILHHLYGRLSGHEPWGGCWRQSTTTVLRHRSRV